MILKSLSRKSNQTQLINYVLRYTVKEKQSKQDKETVTIILRHNLRSRAIQGIIQEYKENESFRLYKRKNAAVLFHDIISFAPSEKHRVTDTLLKDMAKRYVELRGTNNLYLAVAHRDKTAHSHLHFVVSGSQLNGRSSRVSKQQFRHIKIELETYQREKYPELIASRNEHTSSKAKSKEALMEHVTKNRQTHKQSIIKHLEQGYTKSTSHEDFIKHLASKYEPYYRNGNLQGVMVEGRKYRLSRLGYDTEKLQELDHRAPSLETQMQELQSIRSRKSRKQERTNAPQEQPNQTDQNELTALASIRNRSAEQEIEERTIEPENAESVPGDDANELLPSNLLSLKSRFMPFSNDD